MQPAPRSPTPSSCMSLRARVVVLPAALPPWAPSLAPVLSLTVKVLRPRAIDSRRGWSFYRGPNAIAKSERVSAADLWWNGSFPSREIEIPQSQPGRSATFSQSSFHSSTYTGKLMKFTFCDPVTDITKNIHFLRFLYSAREIFREGRIFYISYIASCMRHCF